MVMKRKKDGPASLRRCIAALGLFLCLLLMMYLFDTTPWTLNFREGTLFENLLNSTFFTEWFVPYRTPEFNVLTVLFAVIFVPEIIISTIEYINARRKKQ
ncbi:YfzA family protein [Metabacillus malikii]|uniref:YfzA-like protein n=1 Tax=Metabacillus malikii TaxID=1504265 RepID=A0ABT9ZD22_9BACI|nr:YfzA family protein [Metabacillus malikii]MDQ0229145.1 hypothetical protein [Metabacillus malikii]